MIDRQEEILAFTSLEYSGEQQTLCCRGHTVIVDHSEYLDVYKGRAQATCGCQPLSGGYCFGNWGITEVLLLSSPVRDKFVLMVFFLII